MQVVGAYEEKESTLHVFLLCHISLREIPYHKNDEKMIKVNARWCRVGYVKAQAVLVLPALGQTDIGLGFHRFGTWLPNCFMWLGRSCASAPEILKYSQFADSPESICVHSTALHGSVTSGSIMNSA